jgi:hypothetical protein
LEKVKRSSEGFSWYNCDDLRAQIETQICQKYKPGDFREVRPLNWDEIIEQDDDDDSWADPGAPSCRSMRPGYGNDIEVGESEENTQGAQKATGKGKGTQDGKGKRKGKGKGNGTGKGIVK